LAKDLKLFYWNGEPLWNGELNSTDKVSTVIERQNAMLQKNEWYQKRFGTQEPGQAIILPLRMTNVGLSEVDENLQLEPSILRLRELRKAFVEGGEYEGARFENQALRDDTEAALLRLLDDGFSAGLADKLLLLAGDETVFDYEVQSEFQYRDAAVRRATTTQFTKASMVPGKVDCDEEDAKKGSDSLWCLECFFRPGGRGYSPFPRGDDEPFGNESMVQRRRYNALPVEDPQVMMLQAKFSARFTVDCDEVDCDEEDAKKGTFRGLNQTNRRFRQSAVLDAYNRAYASLIERRDSKGKCKRNVLVPIQKRELINALSDMYVEIRNRLDEADGDENALHLDVVVDQFKDAISTCSRVVPIVSKEEHVFTTMLCVSPFIALAEMAYGLYFFATCVQEALAASSRKAIST